MQTLDKIVVNHTSKTSNDDLLPIERGGEKRLKVNQLDTEGLKVMYYDDRHKCDLPIFAAASIDSSVCEIAMELRPMGWIFRNDLSGSLTEHLPSPTIFDKALERVIKDQSALSSGRWFGFAFVAIAAIVQVFFYTLFMSGYGWTQHPALASSIVIGVGASLILTHLSEVAMVWFRKIRRPNTPENAHIHNKAWSTNFFVRFPGVLPEHIKQIIKNKKSEYINFHLVWDAENQWETSGMKCSAAPNPDPLLFGELECGKFILLGQFDVLPREQNLKKFLGA